MWQRMSLLLKIDSASLYIMNLNFLSTDFLWFNNFWGFLGRQDSRNSGKSSRNQIWSGSSNNVSNSCCRLSNVSLQNGWSLSFLSVHSNFNTLFSSSNINSLYYFVNITISKNTRYLGRKSRKFQWLLVVKVSSFSAKLNSVPRW